MNSAASWAAIWNVARRVRSARKVDRIPELGIHELIGVVIDTDHATVLRAKFGSDFVEGRVCRRIFRSGVESGTKRLLAHVEDVQQSAVPEWLPVETHLRAFIKIDRNAHPAKREIALRSPRRAGLPVG